MAYRQDPNLEFLQEMDDQDLNDLVYCLTHDKDDKKRFTEELTKSEGYKQFHPKHSKYWQEIASELQYFGANSIVSAIRRKGVTYDEILSDVCDKVLKEKRPKDISIEEVEKKLLMRFFSSSLEQMSREQLQELARKLNFSGNVEEMTPNVLIVAAQAIFKYGGFRSYQLTLIIANAISKAIFSRGLSFAANAALARAAGVLMGPIGWTLTGLWTAVDLAGPAYRVTIPAVIQIAVLREKHKQSKEDLQNAIDKEFDIDPEDL